MNLTLMVVAITVTFLIIFDLWIAYKKGSNATISWQMLLISKKYPIVPFAIGVVAGHIFASMNP